MATGTTSRQPTVYKPLPSVYFTSVAGTTAPRTSPTPTVAPSPTELASQRPTATPSPTAPPRHQPQTQAKAEPKATAPRTSPTKGDFSATVAAARRYALDRLGEEQFACLDTLVRRESGWRVTATNRSSGAYGLPQALPGSKMAKYGDDWRTNATTQLRWMVAYVNGRYGSACQALSHAQRIGWY